jgi:hypothetical protein
LRCSGWVKSNRSSAIAVYLQVYPLIKFSSGIVESSLRLTAGLLTLSITKAARFRCRFSMKTNGLHLVPESLAAWQAPKLPICGQLSVSNPQFFPHRRNRNGTILFQIRATIFSRLQAIPTQRKAPPSGGAYVAHAGCETLPGLVGRSRWPWSRRAGSRWPGSRSSGRWLRRRRRNAGLHIVGVNDLLGDVGGRVEVEHRLLLAC